MEPDDMTIMGWNEHNDHADGDERDPDQVYMEYAIKVFTAVVGDDDETARARLAEMALNERKALRMDQRRLLELIEDVEAVRCEHCNKRIGKVPAGSLRNSPPDATYWFHHHNNANACDGGGTQATPPAERDQ